jgi:hypothetical protein
VIFVNISDKRGADNCYVYHNLLSQHDIYGNYNHVSFSDEIATTAGETLPEGSAALRRAAQTTAKKHPQSPGGRGNAARPRGSLLFRRLCGKPLLRVFGKRILKTGG